ncbi:MAG: glycine cleavage T C-terminal barrel domain-containing protein [Shimia sp.]
MNGIRIDVTTSGTYDHTLGHSVAVVMVDPTSAEPGLELAVCVVGNERQAKRLAPPSVPKAK